MGKQKRQTAQAAKDSARPANEARTAENKRRRVEAQEIQRQANVVRRHMGTPTPWEWACMARASRRRYVLAS